MLTALIHADDDEIEDGEMGDIADAFFGGDVSYSEYTEDQVFKIEKMLNDQDWKGLIKIGNKTNPFL